MRSSRPALRAMAVASLAGLCLGALVSAAPAAVAAPPTASTTPAAAVTAVSRISWFHDPLTAAQRRSRVGVPAHPRRYHGRLRLTKAFYRTHAGRLAVPAGWAVSHALAAPQALTFDRAGLFKVMSTTPSRFTRQQVRQLTKSFAAVRSIRCEGYADHAGRPGRERPISLARARAICKLIKNRNPSISARSVGYGGTHPAVIGGRASQRAVNRRVVVAVTASKPAGPSAPRLLKVKGGDHHVVVTFTASASHAELVTAYQVSLDGGKHWTTLDDLVGDGPYTVTLPGTAGKELQVVVRALWSGGAVRGGTAPLPATPYGVPGAPKVVKTKSLDAAASVFFTAADDNGADITRYQINFGDGWEDVDVAPFDGVWNVKRTDLTNGTEYSVRVRAWNKGGPGIDSDVAHVTPLGQPDAPVLDSAVPGDGTAQLTFQAPADDGGTPVTGYQVSTDGGTTWRPQPVTGDSPFTVDLHGLANGVEASVVVRAKNIVGWGQPSNSLTVTPVSGAPSAPQILSSADGAYKVTVTFAAPTTNADHVTGYEYSTDDGGTWTGATDSDLSGTGPFTLKLGGLEPGASPEVRVRATWSGGHGAQSASTSPTAYGVPGTPDVVGHKGGDGSISVTFEAPAHDGGRPVTDYQVNFGQGWVDVTSGPVQGRWTVKAGGFLNGVTYAVQVRAANLAGYGPATDAVEVTPLAVPAAPVLDAPVAGDGSVQLTFAAPTDEGGTPVTDYQVSTDGGETWVSRPVSGASPYSLTLDDLTNGVELSVTVRAGNAVGWSEPSTARKVTPVSGAPSAPQILDMGAGAYSVTVTFGTSEVNADHVTGYAYTIDDGETWTQVSESDLVGSGPYTLTLRDLNPGQGVAVRVRATWSGGYGAASQSASPTPYGVPGTPNIVATTGRHGAIMVSFAAPEGDGGSKVTGYQISYGEGWVDVTGDPVDGVWKVMQEGFTNGATYQVRVRAVNLAGPGKPTDSVDVTPLTTPAAPDLGLVTAGDQMVGVRFDPPPANPGAPVDGYQATTNGGDDWFDVSPEETGNGQELRVSLTGLQNGTAYDVAVRAVNIVGEGAASGTLTRTPFTVPGAPGMTSATSQGRKVTVTFTAPESNGGSDVTGYQYQVQQDGEWLTVEPSGDGPFSATVEDLPNAAYSFRVRAVNDAGPGAASEVGSVTVEVLASEPAAPILNWAYIWSGSTLDMYTYVPDDNGAPITGWEWSTDNGITWHPVEQPGSSTPGDWTYMWTNNAGPWACNNDYYNYWGCYNSVEVNVQVRAVNAEGPGPASNTVRAYWDWI
jgi:outer membrane protein OmpA-like peptidoglycan-associated protein